MSALEEIQRRRRELDREEGRYEEWGRKGATHGHKGSGGHSRRQDAARNEYRALGAIREEPGISVTDLAERCGWSQSKASIVSQRLREDGLVEGDYEPSEPCGVHIALRPVEGSS